MRENKQKGKDQLKLLSVQNTTPPPIPRPTETYKFHRSHFLNLNLYFLYCSLLIFNFINVHVLC